MIKDRTVDTLLTMPKESYGKCIATTRSGKRCNREETLADGLCIKCWDRSVGHKDDIICKVY